MKRTLAIMAISILFLLPIFADAQSGGITGTITDNSLVFKGYYQGYKQSDDPSDDKTITLSFKVKDGTDINHDAQGGTTGTVVEADSSHIGSNTDVIFTWTMEGKTASEVTLKFTFSTMQAHVNGKYFRPTYTITMSQDVTTITSRTVTESVTERSYDNQATWSENSRRTTDTSSPSTNSYSDDPFYSSADTSIGATKPDKPAESEYTETQNTVYIGSLSDYTTSSTTYGTAERKGNAWNRYYQRTNTVTTKSIESWTRSGSCSLNIADYEKSIPGTYRYSCYVIAEFTVV